MMFNVPQFVDIEDKIAGPLTWKQLLWMIGMGAVLLIILNTFDTALAIVIAIPVVLLFVALAFYKPNGFPLTSFIYQAVMFLFRPKVAIWERPVNVTPMKKEEKIVTESVAAAPHTGLTQDKLKELAHLIDDEK